MPYAKDPRFSAHKRVQQTGARTTKKPGRDYWFIDDIVDERKSSSGVEYLVRWQGKNPKTLREWPLEWIPRNWVNKAAESSWQTRKRNEHTPRPQIASSTDPDDSSNGPHLNGKAEHLTSSKVAPGAYVQVAVAGKDITNELYPVIYGASQPSQTSSEATRDTLSWCEDSSQHSPALQTQLSPSQPPLSLLNPSESAPSTIDLSSPARPQRVAGPIPASSIVTSGTESCSIRRFSLSNSNSLSEKSSGVELVSIVSIPSAQVVTPLISDSVPLLYTQTSEKPGHRPRHRTIQDSGSFVSLPSTPFSTASSFFTPQQSITVVQESPNAADNPATDCPSLTITNSAPIVTYFAAPSHRESILNSQGSAYTQIPPTPYPNHPQHGPAQYSKSSLPAVTNKMSSSVNGGRPPSFPSPPMQDRVRSIRNSAMSTQNRRGASDDNSPMSSRSNSLAPESGRAKASNESRADSRPPDPAAISQFLEHFPEDSDSSESSVTAKYELNIPANGENMEYYLALPLPSRVKSQYDATIKFYKTPMAAFLEGVLDAETVQSMQRLVERLNNVSTHIDLENEEWTRTQNELPEDQTKWALSSGSKFVFLQSLCNRLRDENMHVVVVAKEQRLLFILEKFMQGIQIDYVRPDSGKRTLTSSQSKLKVSLIQPGAESQKGPWSTANVVVAFDGSFDANAKHIKTLRQNSATHGGLAPVVHPLVYCSAEHLSKCIEGLEELRTDQDRLRALILAIEERQSELGEMQDEDFRADAAGEEVGQFVAEGGSKNRWTLVPVRPVKVLSLETILPDDISPVPEAGVNIQDSIGSPTRKRHSEEDLYDEGQKRQRMSPIEETTHISESTDTPSHARITELQRALDAAESAARKSEQQLESMQMALDEKAQEITDKGKVIDSLQTRYEKSKRSIMKQISENGILEKQLIELKERYEKLDASKGQLKEESRSLAAQLEEARGELTQSQTPEVAQLEQIRSENRTLQSEKEKLERKAKGVSQDFEFTRQQYQQASSAAAEHAQRVQQLEEENEVLRRKASGDAIRAREMTNRSETERHLAENARLMAENEELKEQLKRKERGRGMTTRTGSAAPRSPRLGTSPGRSRAGSRAPGSRPGSPVRNVHGARRRGAPLESL